MVRLILGIVALSLATPVMAHDDKDNEKKRLVFKFSIDVPVESPANSTYNPDSFSLYRSPESGFDNFLSDFLVDPQKVNITPGHPYLSSWSNGRGSVHGFGRSSKYRRGDEVYLASAQSARTWQTGIPFGVSFDFLPKGGTWVSLGWQMSKTTVVQQRHWRDRLRIEGVDSQYLPSLDAVHFFVGLTRHRESGESNYRLTNHYVTVAIKHDLFPDFQYASLMPTAGGRLWTLRESVHRETHDNIFMHDFFPELRGQSAESALGTIGDVRRDDHVRYQNSVQWFAGLSGEVYPWGKRGVFGIGARAVYIFNNRDVESPDYRFDFTSPGWQMSAQAILAF